jgi:serine/threonine-protein phosphatase 2B regulatory subunit
VAAIPTLLAASVLGGFLIDLFSWFHACFLRGQRSGSSLSLGERLCAVFFPFIAIAEAVFFAFTDCLADLCPDSGSSASGAGGSSSAAKNSRSNHHQHHYRPFLRRAAAGGWTSLNLRQLARLADESRCCKKKSIQAYPHLFLFLGFSASISQCCFI